MLLLVTLLADEERRALLERAVAIAGGKAALGRKLGYQDGAFIGQMLRGNRAITEKTLREMAGLQEFKLLFEPPKAGASEPEPTAAPPALAAALPIVLDALVAAPARDKVRAALLALLEDDAPAYRQRLAELLDPAKADVIKALTPVPSVESPRFQPQQLSTTERSRE